MIDFSEYDYIIVGCGLTGSVIARHLAEKNKKVIILEKRGHIGGNMYDYIDEHGFLVQKYGPHTFHTVKKELYEYMCRYEKWNEYKLTYGAYIDGKCTPTSFCFKTIDYFYSPEDAEKLRACIHWILHSPFRQFLPMSTLKFLDLLFTQASLKNFALSSAKSA